MIELGLTLGFAMLLADLTARLRVWRLAQAQGVAPAQAALSSLAARFAESGPGKPTEHPFQRAISWFRDRVPFLDAGAAAQAADFHRRQGFEISALMGDTVREKINGVFANLLQSGESFRDFKAAAEKVFAQRPVRRLTDARLAVIYRNNLQSSYDAGRMVALRSPAVSRAFPFWVWRTAQDGFVRPAQVKRTATGFKPTTGPERAEAREHGDHRILHGVFAHVTHPLSGELTVPAGHQCRCVRVPLSASQALALGLIDEGGVVLLPVGKLSSDYTKVIERGQNPDWKPDPGFLGNRVLGALIA